MWDPESRGIYPTLNYARPYESIIQYPAYDYTNREYLRDEEFKQSILYAPGGYLNAAFWRTILEKHFTLGILRQICKEEFKIRKVYSSVKKTDLVNLISEYLGNLLRDGKLNDYRQSTALLERFAKVKEFEREYKLFRPLESTFNGKEILRLSEEIDLKVEWPSIKPLIYGKPLTPIIPLNLVSTCKQAFFRFDFEYHESKGDIIFLLVFKIDNTEKLKIIKEGINEVREQIQERIHFSQELIEEELAKDIYRKKVNNLYYNPLYLIDKHLNRENSNYPSSLDSTLIKPIDSTNTFIPSDKLVKTFEVVTTSTRINASNSPVSLLNNPSRSSAVPKGLPKIGFRKDLPKIEQSDLVAINYTKIIIELNGSQRFSQSPGVFELSRYLLEANSLSIDVLKGLADEAVVQIVTGRVDLAAWNRIHGEQEYPLLPVHVIKEAFFHTRTEEDFEQLDFTLSLKCPLALTRIKTPIRSRICRHIQCCELSSLLLTITALSHSHFNCPVCGIFVKKEALVIDGYMKLILESCGEEVEEVLVNSKTGEWKIKTSMVEPINDEDYMPPTKFFKPAPEDVISIMNPPTDESVGSPGSSITNAIVIE